ncbi:MAG: NUDIX hydrolase [Thermotogota bacterium]
MGYIFDLRKHIGSKPIIMVGAGVVILDDKNRILLQRRKDNNSWSLIGGSMEPGETFEETAIREAKEEAGIDINSLKPIKVFSGKEMHHKYPNGDEVYNVASIFLVTSYTGEIIVNDHESHEHKFFDIKEIPSKLNPPDAIMIKYIKENLNAIKEG